MKINFEHSSFGVLWLVKAAGHVNLPTLLEMGLRSGLAPGLIMVELERCLADGAVREYSVLGKLTTYSVKPNGEGSGGGAGSGGARVLTPIGPEMEEKVMALIDTEWGEKEFTPNSVYKKLIGSGEGRWNKMQVEELLQAMQDQKRVARRREGKFMGKKFWFLGLAHD